MGCPKDVWASIERGESSLIDAVTLLRRRRSPHKESQRPLRVSAKPRRDRSPKPAAKPSLKERLLQFRQETLAELDRKLESVLREHERPPLVEVPRQCPEALKPWLIATNASLQSLLTEHDFFACDYGATGNATNDFFLTIDEAYRELVHTINSLQGKRLNIQLGSRDILTAFHALGLENVDLDNAPVLSDVKTRYRALTKRLHPDRTGREATPSWHKVLEAYHLLCDWYERTSPNDKDSV